MKYASLLTASTLISGVITHPFTVLTILQQSRSSSVKGIDNKSSFRALKDAAEQIGLEGLLRGWAPVVLLNIPSQVIYVWIQERTREFFRHELKKLMPKASATLIEGAQSLASSIIANGVSLVPYVPGEVITSRMITEGKKEITTAKMIRQMWKENGIKGFFRGSFYSFATHTLYSTNWWWWYSVCRRKGYSVGFLRKNPFLLDTSTGVIAGIVATLASHPLDTLKTRIMTSTNQKRRGFIQQIVAREGLFSLMHGLKASMYHAAFISALFSLSYELIKRVCSLDLEYAASH